MEGELVCNFKKCRKRLNTFAWITSCSHIFCDEDGTKEFSKSFTCPACENTLSGKFDIVRIDLQPSEQYKSMVLAGQKPETVMEICSRALSFWTYQEHQERTYQEYVASRAKERAVQLEQYYEQIISRTQTELTTLKTQLSTTKKELDASKKKCNEVSEKLLERSRQYQKLQSLYDAMRRKCITPLSFEGSNAGDATPNIPNAATQNFSLPLSSGDEVLRSNAAITRPLHHCTQKQNSPAEREFVLRPSTRTPTIPATSVNDLQNKFSFSLNTPKR